MKRTIIPAQPGTFTVQVDSFLGDDDIAQEVLRCPVVAWEVHFIGTQPPVAVPIYTSEERQPRKQHGADGTDEFCMMSSELHVFGEKAVDEYGREVEEAAWIEEQKVGHRQRWDELYPAKEKAA